VTTVPQEAGEKIRLLFCETCNSIEELPDFDGPVQYDTLLEIAASRHRTPSGDPHIGKLFDVDVAMWAEDSVRRQIIEQIKGKGSKGLAEFDATFYDTRSTFHEDALKCYQDHLRPKGACPDWMSDKKILLPDTKAERKAEGLASPSSAPGPKVRLCDFCPAKRYYADKARGMK
jgi:hypothetical protein